jgi:UDP-3-O-[3-hydroxymyristoyl] glucosamine N-acyltransferase
VIDADVEIGSGTYIAAHVYIGPETKVGAGCILHPHVVVREGCSIGDRVILQPGAVIGSCGFGYTTSAEGHHTKLAQIGTVQLADDVEIGANTAIDRGRFASQSTRIECGTKLDNLIQIAHGVTIGAHCVIAGQTGIAGSTKIGAHTTIGGQVAIAGHLTLANRVTIAGKSGVAKSLSSGVYGGIPAQPISDYNRSAVIIRQLPTLLKQLQAKAPKNSGSKTKHFFSSFLNYIISFFRREQLSR